MPVRRVKSQLELGLTRPRVFRQWKLGSEPSQFGDLSVTEAQIYLATDSDIEAIFLPGFWAKTDPVYDPHRLVAHADALNRPYIGMQIAIPAPWVEVTVRYSKQTAQTLARLGRTSRKGYRLAREQIRSRRAHQDPAVPHPVTSCGCGFSDNHCIDGDWIELPRLLTSEGVLHVLRVWPVSACGQVVSNPDAARTFEPRRHLETEKPWQYCPHCWPIAKRRLLDLFREQMMGVPKSVASQAAENGASSPVSAHQASQDGMPFASSYLYPRQTVSFSIPERMTGDAEGQASIKTSGLVVTRGTRDGEVDVHLTGIASTAEVDLLSRILVLDHAGVAHGDTGKGRPLDDMDRLIPGLLRVARTYCDRNSFVVEDLKQSPPSLANLHLQPFLREQCKAYCAECLAALGLDSTSVQLRPAESLPPPAEPESAQLNKEEASGQMPTFLLTESKAYLPTILQEAGLISSRDRARAAINDGSVAIEGWPPITHRHTFKSKDLNGKTLAIGGIAAMRFTTRVAVDPAE